MICPNCHLEIEKENINVQTDVAHCLHCNSLIKLSNIVKLIDNDFNLFNHPEGTWIKNQFNSIVIGATTRSPIAFVQLPFLTIWSGAAFWNFFIRADLFKEFNLIAFIFFMVFCLFGSVFWIFTFMNIWGKVQISLDIKGGAIFTGIGNIGFTREFKWDEIKTINESPGRFYYNNIFANQIRIETKDNSIYVLGINRKRLSYLLNSLNKIHSNIKILGRLI